MPLYDYECPECGHTEEVLERADSEAAPDCERCGETMTRNFPSPAVHFKGSGFYETDYGREADREVADDE